ncbi:MAG: MgtC/SapB family protein [Parcubacteria group bacterium]|nr:MgtC/SapB family protein [Parcubacteria group bacterium]
MTDFLNSQNLEIFGQLSLAVFLGALIGIERRIAGKRAGMRTYALVSMGSALFSIISAVAFSEFIGRTNFDPARIVSQIVVGVGFIGAGTVIFQRSSIHGLTTAAGIWVAAGIGTAVGLKLYSLAVFATILTIVVFIILWLIEKKLIAKWPYNNSESEAGEN